MALALAGLFLALASLALLRYLLLTLFTPRDASHTARLPAPRA